MAEFPVDPMMSKMLLASEKLVQSWNTVPPRKRGESGDIHSLNVQICMIILHIWNSVFPGPSTYFMQFYHRYLHKTTRELKNVLG